MLEIASTNNSFQAFIFKAFEQSHLNVPSDKNNSSDSLFYISSTVVYLEIQAFSFLSRHPSKRKRKMRIQIEINQFKVKLPLVILSKYQFINIALLWKFKPSKLQSVKKLLPGYNCRKYLNYYLAHEVFWRASLSKRYPPFSFRYVSSARHKVSFNAGL